MSSAHRDAVDQSKRLEKVSDENLIYYFKPELEEIGRGVERAVNLLPDSVIGNFLRLGVLEYHGARGHVVTARALQNIKDAKTGVSTP